MKSSSFRNSLLLLEFNGTPIANIADNAASSPLTQLWFSLHTAWPGYGSAQNVSEAAYTGYARKSVARNGTGFVVTGNSVALAANLLFDERTDAGAAVEIPFFAIGRASSGASIVNRLGIFGTKAGAITGATSDAVTVPGHTLVVNDRVVAIAADGQALPTGITEGALYWVKTVSGNDITLSATQGGATLDITAAGVGLLFRCTPHSVSQGVAPAIKSAMVLTEN